MKPEITNLVKRRREALAEFIETNSALFGLQDYEVEDIRERHEDDEEGVSDGPFMLTRWVLIMESQSISDPDEGLVSILRRPGTTYIEQLGLLKRAIDY